MDRKKAQADLLRKLGAFLAPIDDLATRPQDFCVSDRRRLLARVAGDSTVFANQVITFMHERPGRPYTTLQQKFANALKRLVGGGSREEASAQDIKGLLEECVPLMQGAIMEVPIENVTGVLEADSPFTAYCRINDLCRATFGVLIWTDRYFDAAMFSRYLRDIRPLAAITLVTLDPSKLNHSNDEARYRDFLDISRLFAAERGPDHYRLVVHPNFHDRWLRSDGELYALGGSVKDAGVKSDFAIAKIEPTPDNFMKLNDLVDAGTELFGSSNPVHP